MTTYKGTHITDFDSTPPDVVNARLHGGVVKIAKDAFEIADTGNADSVILFRLPIDAVVHRVYFACDDLTSGTVDIGTYKKNADGTYTAVDDDCFASAIALGSGAVALTDVTYEAGAALIADALQPLWERSNLSARPAYGDLYIALTTDTGTGATGTVYVEVQYTE